MLHNHKFGCGVSIHLDFAMSTFQTFIQLYFGIREETVLVTLTEKVELLGSFMW